MASRVFRQDWGCRKFPLVSTGPNRSAAGGKVFRAWRSLQRRDPSGQIVQEVALTEGSLLAKITGRRALGVNSSHHQAVRELAELLVARTRDSLVEAMELKPEARKQLPFLLSVQFHPERLAQKHAAHHALFRS